MTTSILIAFASSYGQTRKIAGVLAERLRARGFDVDLANASSGRLPPPEDYSVVAIGSSVRYGRHAAPIVDYLRANRDGLSERPVFFFSVCNAAVDHGGEPDPNGYVQATFAEVGWRTEHTAVFAGALPYTKYGWLTRWMMKSISRKGGRTTDTSRDHEFTDWTQVDAFADAIARQAQQRKGSARELGIEPDVRGL